MRAVRPAHRRIFCCLSVAILFAARPASADPLAIGRDGWFTWKVPAPGGAPAWCCVKWNAGTAKPTACDLDTRNGDHNFAAPGRQPIAEMQIYALLDAGQPRRIRALDPRCEISTHSPITDLGLVPAERSIDWLLQSIAPRAAISEDTLAAISVHDSAHAARALISVVEDRHLDNGTRRTALFWLVESGSDPAMDYLTKLFAGK
jgi:hypothetical protein